MVRSPELKRLTKSWKAKYHGYLYGLSFNFENNDAYGYIGYQPLEGDLTNRLIFSAFGENITTVSSYCNDGADDGTSYGPGVSCRSHYPYELGKNYTTEIVRTSRNADGSNTWSGYLHDNAAGVKIVIGEFTTAGNIGLLQNNVELFDSWYLNFNSGQCLPHGKDISYFPTLFSENGTAYAVAFKDFANYDGFSDACTNSTGKPNYKATLLNGAILFESGFLAK